MQTECSAERFDFAPVEKRAVVAGFDGGTITSDAGALLLGLTDRAIGVIGRFARCFIDARNPDLIEHEVRTLVGQRIFALALGYEDLNDHDELRHDPVMAARRHKKCAAVAGKSTLNRLELSPPAARAITRSATTRRRSRRCSSSCSWVHTLPRRRRSCWIWMPPTLYVFCGDHLLCAKLRPANIDAAAGAVQEIERIVRQIRQRWPKVRIVLRADSGFARKALMAWCESNAVDYLFGLARNVRLVRHIGAELEEARAESAFTGRPARRFKDFPWTTRKSWSCRRRIVAKADWTQGEANPRFVVTSLDA